MHNQKRASMREKWKEERGGGGGVWGGVVEGCEGESLLCWYNFLCKAIQSVILYKIQNHIQYSGCKNGFKAISL